jgi:hypothetical protein
MPDTTAPDETTRTSRPLRPHLGDFAGKALDTFGTQAGFTRGDQAAPDLNDDAFGLS